MLKVTLISIILIIVIGAFAMCARGEEEYVDHRSYPQEIGLHAHYYESCGVCNNYNRIKALEARIEKLEEKTNENKPDWMCPAFGCLHGIDACPNHK